MQSYLFVLLLFCETILSCRPDVGRNRVLAAEISGPNLPKPDMTPRTVSEVIFQSDDAGTTWKDISFGLPDDDRPNTIGSSNGVIYIGMNNGVLHNAAVNGIWEKEELFDETIFEIYPGSAGPYVLTQWNGLYQNLLGAVWVPMHKNLKDRSLQTAYETTQGVLLVGCENGISRSATKGNVWEKVTTGYDVKTFWESNGVLIAGCRNGLLRSVDGGLTWEPVLKTQQAIFTVRSIDNELIALVENFQNDDNTVVTRLIYRSIDNGVSWQCINDSLPTELLSMYELERVGNHLVACSNAGIFRSADRGKTWEKIHDAPPQKNNFYRMTVSGQSIYLLVSTGC